LLETSKELTLVKADKESIENEVASKLCAMQTDADRSSDANVELRYAFDKALLENTAVNSERNRLESLLCDYSTNLEKVEALLREETDKRRSAREEIHRLELERNQTRIWIEDQAQKTKTMLEVQQAEIKHLKDKIEEISIQSSSDRLVVELSEIIAAYKSEQERTTGLERELNDMERVIKEKDDIIKRLSAKIELQISNRADSVTIPDVDFDLLSDETDREFKSWVRGEKRRSKVSPSKRKSVSLVETRSPTQEKTANVFELQQQLDALTSERDGLLVESVDRQVAIEKLTGHLLQLESERDILKAELRENTFKVSAHTESDLEIAKLQDRVAELESLLVETQPLIQELEEKRVRVETMEKDLRELTARPKTPIIDSRAAELESVDILFKQIPDFSSSRQSRATSPSRVSRAASPVHFGAFATVSSRDRDLELLKMELQMKCKEIESIHEDYKDLLQEAEEKIRTYAELSESSVLSMEVYRVEVAKKNKKIEDLESEIFSLKINVDPFALKETPDTR
jgi:chromosome segregation ATPase